MSLWGEPIGQHSSYDYAADFKGTELMKSSIIPADILDIRNPESKEKFKGYVGASNFKVLDFGPGYEPILSVDQQAGDIWVGAEPDLRAQYVMRGRRRVQEGSKRFLLGDSADAIPKFTADLIIMIAPNPRDIEGGVLYQLEKFIEPGTQIFILLDKRTIESQQYGADARNRVKEFFKEMRIKPGGLNLKGRQIDTSGSRDAIGGTVFTGRR